METMLNSSMSSSAKPSTNQMFAVECARSQTPVSVLKIQQPGTTPGDLQFFRLGLFDIATQGAGSDYEDAAQLYVTYRIRFKKPRLASSAGTSLMYLADTLGTSLANMFVPIPDSIAVKQPRVNTLGLTLDNYADGLARLYFPLNTQTGAVFQVTVMKYGNDATAVNIPMFASVPSGGLVNANVFADQTSQYLVAPISGTNTGCDTCVLISNYVYDGTGTASSPPCVDLSFTGNNPPGQPLVWPGNIQVIRIDAACNTGLTSVSSQVYTREQFFRFLCDAVAGRKTYNRPPGDYRLVDWVHQFTKTSKWPIDKKLPRSGAAFDTTLMEALGSISRFTGSLATIEESKTSDPDIPYHSPPPQLYETEYEQVLTPLKPPVLVRQSGFLPR
jgi:hypothetical protein